ncbi:MAG TPA: hypothetical protein VJ749_01675 [Pyrinomonadaceae bacterium]|nr:hypothetical protein [Pyrinomonadaceae bacterium]
MSHRGETTMMNSELPRRAISFGWTWTLFTLVILFVLPQTVRAQWATSGNNINNTNTGNVGVGTTTPAAKVAVATSSAAVNATVTITPDGTNNYYANNPHTALFVDGTNLSPHGSYTGALVRLFHLRAQGGFDAFMVGRNGDMLTSPSTNSSTYNLRLAPDSITSYYAGSDYDILLINGQNMSAHGSYTGKTVRPLRVTNQSGGDAFVIARDGNATFGGNVTVSGNIAAKYQDMAEWVPARQQLIAGTVVTLDPEKSNQVMASTQAYDTRVAGVVSSQPGIALGESGSSKLLVATTGRVKVKVDATRSPIRIGDLLVTSDKEGFAMKSEPITIGGRQIHAPGTLIGKALEPLASGTGEILVLLSLQ